MQFRNVLDNFTRVLLAFVALLLLSMPRVSAYDKWHLSCADMHKTHNSPSVKAIFLIVKYNEKILSYCPSVNVVVA